MKLVSDTLTLAPTDLNHFVNCRSPLSHDFGRQMYRALELFLRSTVIGDDYASKCCVQGDDR